jgi:PPOX class probable F420-dependent enzyme
MPATARGVAVVAFGVAGAAVGVADRPDPAGADAEQPASAATLRDAAEMTALVHGAPRRRPMIRASHGGPDRFLAAGRPVYLCMSNQTFHDPFRTGRPGQDARQTAERILSGPHLAILSTSNQDGSPQASVIFVKPDGDDLLFSTIKGRRKTVNMQRDARVSLLIHSLPTDGGEFTYAVLSGPVQLTDDPENAFHQVMYDLHMGGAPAPVEPGAERLIVRLRTERVYAPPPYVATD